MLEFVELCHKIFVDKSKKLSYNFIHDNKNFIIYIDIFNRQKNYNSSICERNSKKDFKLNNLSF